jgi:hypothetical protein
MSTMRQTFLPCPEKTMRVLWIWGNRQNATLQLGTRKNIILFFLFGYSFLFITFLYGLFIFFQRPTSFFPPGSIIQPYLSVY